MTFNYQVGGSLPADAPSYVERQCDRDYYELLKERKYCYVFNCRQMGKSSLRVRVTHKLQAEGIVCATIDPQKIGVEVTCEQWYASAIRSLVGDLDLKSKFDLRSWIRERELLSPVQRFAEFIETVVLQEIDAPIVIFVEEIDRLLSLKFGMDDFFGLVRSFFEDRPTKPDYNRLTFSFLGVATPTDLIQSHNTSAFNIGYAVEMAGFTLTEALPLMQGLASKVANPQDYLAEAVKWTGGQPFLIQRLLGMMEKELAGIAPPENIAGWVENLVQERIVTNWESQDAPPHLATIRDRVLSVEEKLRGRMLGCYQQVLADGELEDDRSEERSKLRLTGLVVRRDGMLVSYNPIYAAVFDNKWVEGQLADLRPEFYASAFRAWRDAEEEQNQGFLLRGQALEEAEVWARGKKLSDIDEQFLRESREIEKLETIQKLAATEEVNAILINAKQKAAQRIRVGTIFLGITLLAGLITVTLVTRFVNEAKQKVSIEATPLMSRIKKLVEKDKDLSLQMIVRDLDSGTYMQMRANQKISAASTIKVPILVAFFQDVDSGKIKLDEQLEITEDTKVGEAGELQFLPTGTKISALEAATQMIIISDNTATNILIKRLGGFSPLNLRFQSWGLDSTVINKQLPDLDGTNTTSPQDLVEVLTQIDKGQLLTPRSRDRLLDIMRRPVTNTLLPQGIGEEARIIHKTGDIASVVGDVGFIDMPSGKRYVIAVMVKRPNNDQRANELIRQISKITYEYFSTDGSLFANRIRIILSDTPKSNTFSDECINKTVNIQQSLPIATSTRNGKEGFLDEKGVWIPMNEYPLKIEKPNLIVLEPKNETISQWSILYCQISQSQVKILQVDARDDSNLILNTEIGFVNIGTYNPSLFFEQLVMLDRLRNLPKILDSKSIQYLDISDPTNPILEMKPKTEDKSSRTKS
jgi:beta-lactamase class A